MDDKEIIFCEVCEYWHPFFVFADGLAMTKCCAFHRTQREKFDFCEQGKRRRDERPDK